MLPASSGVASSEGWRDVSLPLMEQGNEASTLDKASERERLTSVLDEAASGLDVLARRALLDFVAGYRQPGKLVLYSTHVMSEAEEVCDRVAIVDHGQLLTLDTVAGVLARSGQPSLERAFFSLLQHAAEQQAR